MSYRVTYVVDGDTFHVSPKWTFAGQTGEIVRARGYNTPEEGKPGYETAKEKLKNLILGKDVELRNMITITYGRLLCDVYYNGQNLKDYF